MQVPANTLFDLVCPVPWNVGDRVTWYKNGDILSDTTFANLIIYDNFIGFPSISESDSGKYTCAVNDDLATAQSTIINVVGSQPSTGAGQGKKCTMVTELIRLEQKKNWGCLVKIIDFLFQHWTLVFKKQNHVNMILSCT